MTEQEKINLITNYFAEDWATEKALLLLEDYQKMMETQPPLLDAQYACVAELEQAAHQALEVLDYYAKPLCMCFAGCAECDPSKVPNEQMAVTALRKALGGVQALYTAPQPAPAPLSDDTKRLDWLDRNIFSREMSDWDAKYGHGPDYNMWVIFSPKGAQGSARNIIDAALAAQGGKDA